MDNLDTKFMQRALKVSTFNLQPKDFQSLKYKKEIRTLLATNFFPGFNLDTTNSGVNLTYLNGLVKKLKQLSSSNFNMVFKYPLTGSGPGEVLLYFLIDNGILGGGSSAGVDLIVDGNGYEVKAVDVTRDGYAINFKLGSTFQVSDLVKRAQDIKKQIGEFGSEVNKTTISKIKEVYPDEWNKLENDFRDRAYNNYFKNHPIIFMYNKTQKIGEVISIKEVKKEDIEFERVTSGVIKPKIRVR